MASHDAGDRWLTGGPVYDWLPEPLPVVTSPHIDSVIADARDRGLDPLAVHDLAADERARQFRDDPAFRERVRAHVGAAGVTAFGATMISFGARDPQGWSGVLAAVRRACTYVDAAEWLSKALEPSDLRADGVSMLLQVEDADVLGGDVDRLDDLYDFGVRTLQLTYSDRNLLGDGCTSRTDAGLSHLGVAVLERANDLGVMVELSHCGRATAADAIERSAAPPAFGHSFCRALHDHPRGRSDDELQRLAASDGFVGITAVPFFLGHADGFETMLDHVDHAVDVVGVDRVGIATNWGMWTPDLPGALREGVDRALSDHRSGDDDAMGRGLPPMESYLDWREIPAALADRGYDRQAVRALCGGSFVEYFERVTRA